MPNTLHILLNGQFRNLAELPSPSMLDRVVEALELKADRVAVEHNGEITPRNSWPNVVIMAGDKLEIVHFVGGGRG